MAALRSGRIVPSSAWRAAEVLAAVESAGLPEAIEMRFALGSVVDHQSTQR
jgi:aminoglycoside phosphotransferase (APT) family kinase protein